jgi:hypothetical protein
MVMDALRYGAKYSIEYREVSHNSWELPADYDFYVINWHHMTTTASMSFEYIQSLPGIKIAVVLEADVNNPLPYVPSDKFDAYMVIDPTHKKEGRVYPFPRPLEVVGDLQPICRDNVPVVGSFGFATPGKYFDEVVRMCNETFSSSLVRINLPSATYADSDLRVAKEVAGYARKEAKSHTEVVVTHEYMSKPNLVRWCSENTINMFPYHRRMPGLCAVTDQAISSGRAIAITECDTFRHLHPYMPSYPTRNLRELISITPPIVAQIMKDWHPSVFAVVFEQLLEDQGVL